MSLINPEEWDILETVEYVLNGKFKKVALQFPDHLLHLSPSILMEIVKVSSELVMKRNNESESEILENPIYFLLGDTTYNPCCVDHVAAAHASADIIIHYGHACLASVERVPVYFVFGRNEALRAPENQSAIVHHLFTTVNDLGSNDEKVLFMWDPDCTYQIGQILSALAMKFGSENEPSEFLSSSTGHIITFRSPHPQLIIPPLQISHNPVEETFESEGLINSNIMGFHLNLQADPFTPETMPYLRVVYLGAQETRSRLLLASFSSANITQVYPYSGSVESISSKAGRFISQRYRIIEKIKSASIVGIVVGTLSVALHREMTLLLRKLLAAADIGSYTFLLGKPNPAKLANFPEVDVFVYVSCPESTIFSDTVAATFHSPIATPHEVILALSDFMDGIEGSHLPLESVTQWNSSIKLEYKSVIDIVGGIKNGERCCGKEGDSCTRGACGSSISTVIFEKDEAEDADLKWLGQLEGVDETDKNENIVNLGSELISRPSEKATQIVIDAPGKGLAAEFFSTKRQWKGLAYDVDVEQQNLSIQQGQSGRASGYSFEKNNINF